MAKLPNSGILVEAEAFDDYGGWVMDAQFELELASSPYLLAHGNGKPVADASTVVAVDAAGEYNIWVRTKDWVPGHHPGRFTLTINGTTLPCEFGANDEDWNWESGGRLALPKGKTRLVLHDLTGFCGRCDAIFLSRDDVPPPNEAGRAAWSWRQKICGRPESPSQTNSYDVVVVGGGVPGVAATLTAARLGDRVALIHNLPLLVGNASALAGLRPRGIKGPLIDEITQRHPNGDLYAKQLLDAEQNVTYFLEHTVYDAVTDDHAIVSVDMRDQHSGKQSRLKAPLFIDCSGRAILGVLSGAETLFGQESMDEYGEKLAPVRRDNLHHGNTVFFRTKDNTSPVSFPLVPWATEVAKDYANLGGQLVKAGIDNGEGPVVRAETAVKRRMRLPATHFWEYGQHLDPYMNMEHIRDHLLRAIYGAFSNVKRADPSLYSNLELDWVAYVAATGEFKRYKGDHVLSENDIRDHKHFPDAVVQNDSAFCLHYGGHPKYDFRLTDWIWDERDGKPYDIPFRCLYSCNISNLMMAGKHISVTHVAGANTKFMGNGGQHAIATGAAAHLCKKYGITPRRLCESHMEELRGLARSITNPDEKKVRSLL